VTKIDPRGASPDRDAQRGVLHSQVDPRSYIKEIFGRKSIPSCLFPAHFCRMMTLKCSLLWIIAVCIGLAVSAPFQETNAQRLARGLPPNPPKYLRNLPPTPVLGTTFPLLFFIMASNLKYLRAIILGARSPKPSPQLPVT